MPAQISADSFQDDLQTKRLGRNVFFTREVGSTNDWAKELAVLGARDGTVAIAETQTAGRGRLGRSWISPSGGLWFSVILRPMFKPAETVKLVFVASLAVAEVLHELYGLKTETKWPNDVLVNGRKISGILTEMNTTGETVNYAILGIGVNANFDVEEVFPEELRAVSTSLKAEIGKEVSLEELFRSLLERLEDIYEHLLCDGFLHVLNRWKNFAGFLGRQVEVANRAERFCGLALDVDNEGCLLVRSEDGTLRRVIAGDVLFRVM